MIDPNEFKIMKNGRLVPCNCNQQDDCPPKTTPPDDFDKDGNFEQIGTLLENMDDPCASTDDFLDNVDTKQPEGLGMNPNCLDAARQVLDAVISDALTPRDLSKTGIGGSQSISSILEHQISQIGA